MFQVDFIVLKIARLTNGIHKMVTHIIIFKNLFYRIGITIEKF